MFQYLTFIDLVVPVIFLVIIFLISKRTQLKNIEENPSYKYFIYGLMVKIAGGVAVCLIYVYYYGGGDTLNYYSDCVNLITLGENNPIHFIRYMIGPDPNLALEINWSETAFQYFGDPHARAVVKLTVFLCAISFKSFIGMTILLAWISYWPIWRLYQVLIKEFPNLVFEFAVALFFVPSVFFWGSGLLKDTITFAAVCLSLHLIV
ncbi:MAG: hypothetical protein IPP51_12445 [Bacteroidetes bacterium]|nr:hypothetical protein [Bacteroidota bacterium]